MAQDKGDTMGEGGHGEVGSHRLLIETIDGYVNEEVDDETVRDAYERVTDGFFAVDRDWQITYINEMAGSMLDADTDEVIGENLWDLFPETSGTVFYDKAHEAVEEQEAVSFDGYYDPLDSWYHVNVYPAEDGLSVYFRDVTERVEREKELERYEQIVESSGDVLWMFRADFSEALFVNSAYEDVLGQPVEALDDDPTAFIEVAHPEDRELLRDKIERAKNGEELEFEIRVNPDEGYERWISVRGYPVYEDGEHTAVTGFARDITERVERERRLTEIRERVDLAVDAADLGVWDWDIRTGRVDTNDKWNEMVGREAENVTTADDWKSLVHPDDIDDALDAIDRHFYGSDERYDVEFRMEEGDGWRWIRSVGQVIERDDDGEPLRAIGIHVDIDDSKRREEALRNRNEYLRRIHDASQAMISATVRDDVEDILVDTAAETFEDASFYRWDDGVLRGDDEDVRNGDESPEWEAFSRGEITVEDGDGGTVVCGDGTYAFDGDARHLYAPVGDDGVLRVRLGSFTEATECFVDSVTSSAEASFDRIEMENDLRDVADELREKNAELSRLSEIDEVVRDLIKNVVDAEGSDEIRRYVCENLLEVEGWDHTWFAEETDDGVEATCCHGDEEFTHEIADSLDGSPLERTFEDGEVRVVDDVASAEVSEWRRVTLDNGYLSCATVPVRYGSRCLGVLEVYSSETGSFGNGYAGALTDAAMVAGYAITASEQMEALLSGGFERLTVGIDRGDLDCAFSRLVDRLEAEFRVNAIVPSEDETLVYFNTDAEPDELGDAADEIGVELSQTMNGYGATVDGMSVVETATDLGGRVSRYAPGNDSLIVDVDIPRGMDTRDLLDAVEEEHPSAELVARRSNDEVDVEGSPLDDLTERQRTVLRLAYESGFFETPRKKTGQELADSMGITATTFHQHLRCAEEKIVDAVLDTD